MFPILNNFSKRALVSSISLSSKSIPSFYAPRNLSKVNLYRTFATIKSKPLKKDLVPIDESYTVSEVVIERKQGVVKSLDEIQDDHEIEIKPRDEKVIIKEKVIAYHKKAETTLEKNRQIVFNGAIFFGLLVLGVNILLAASPKILERNEIKQFSKSPIIKDFSEIFNSPVLTDGPACFDQLWMTFLDDFKFQDEFIDFNYLNNGVLLDDKNKHLPLYNVDQVHPMHLLCGENSTLFNNVVEACKLDDDPHQLISHKGAQEFFQSYLEYMMFNLSISWANYTIEKSQLYPDTTFELYQILYENVVLKSINAAMNTFSSQAADLIDLPGPTIEENLYSKTRLRHLTYLLHMHILQSLKIYHQNEYVKFFNSPYPIKDPHFDTSLVFDNNVTKKNIFNVYLNMDQAVKDLQLQDQPTNFDVIASAL